MRNDIHSKEKRFVVSWPIIIKKFPPQKLPHPVSVWSTCGLFTANIVKATNSAIQVLRSWSKWMSKDTATIRWRIISETITDNHENRQLTLSIGRTRRTVAIYRSAFHANIVFIQSFSIPTVIFDRRNYARMLAMGNCFFSTRIHRTFSFMFLHWENGMVLFSHRHRCCRSFPHSHKHTHTETHI